MLKFQVFDSDIPEADWSLRQAHLVGADDIGIRGKVSFANGVIECEKKSVGASALVIQVTLPDVGELVMQTCLLPEREEPYLLSLELARHRLMKCISKQEDWDMLDLPADHPAGGRIAKARQKFIAALGAVERPAEADAMAIESLAASVDASEELALSNAEEQLEESRLSGTLANNKFGVGIWLDQNTEQAGKALTTHFDYLSVPMRWRQLEPAEQEYNWDMLDGWCEWAFKKRLPIVAGPVVSFTPDVVPDWLYIWEHDYETVRDLLYEHVERVVTRYRKVVSLWNVISGIHVNNHFSFNFEQLMDLTRMAIGLTKKIHPSAKTLIEITHPFGEYYAFNQRSIPPIMYAEMVLQAGVQFDGFGLKLVLGRPEEGHFMRDLMQVSSLLDRYVGLGKPLHITATAVPSAPVPAAVDPKAGADVAPMSGGYWRKPWSPSVQGHWLEAFYHMAMSKPNVESIAWLDLADHKSSELPVGGLYQDDFKPKPALRRMVALRQSLHGKS